MRGTDAWLLMFMKPFLSQCSSAKCDMLSLILSWLILMECLDVCFPSWTNRQRASSDWIWIRPKIWFSFFTFRTNRDTVEEIGHVAVSRLKIITLNLIRVQYSISFFCQEGKVTNPSIWSVLSAFRVFQPLLMGAVTLSWVAEYIPNFIAIFFINICCFTARQHF